MSSEYIIHPSHKMTEWENTIVTIIETSRFGRIRECENCGAEEAETVAGHGIFPELLVECQNVKNDD